MKHSISNSFSQSQVVSGLARQSYVVPVGIKQTATLKKIASCPCMFVSVQTKSRTNLSESFSVLIQQQLHDVYDNDDYDDGGDGGGGDDDDDDDDGDDDDYHFSFRSLFFFLSFYSHKVQFSSVSYV